jgi:hypothetical protein
MGGLEVVASASGVAFIDDRAFNAACGGGLYSCDSGACERDCRDGYFLFYGRGACYKAF